MARGYPRLPAWDRVRVGDGNRVQTLLHLALVFGREVMKAPLLTGAILLGVSYAAACAVVASAPTMTLEERLQITPPIIHKPADQVAKVVPGAAVPD